MVTRSMNTLLLTCDEETAQKQIHCALQCRKFCIERLVAKTEKLSSKLLHANETYSEEIQQAIESKCFTPSILNKLNQDYWAINKVIRQLSDGLDNLLHDDQTINLCLENLSNKAANTI